MSVPRSSRWVAKLWRSVCRESVLRSPAAFAACLNSRPNWRVVSGRGLLRPGNSQRCSSARPASYAVGRAFHQCRNRSRTCAGSITCRSPAFAPRRRGRRPQIREPMRFVPTPLDGAFVIELDKREDDRGFFARAFCEREFAAAGLDTRFVQIDNSLSKDKGGLRGMHYQLGEAAEVKVVRCVRGALWDAILDLRPRSGSFGQSYG